MMQDEIKAWRKEMRTRLIAQRCALTPVDRAQRDTFLASALRAQLAGLEGTLAFYWPMRGEFDARPIVTDWLRQNAQRRAALPIVLEKAAPLGFRAWTPEELMVAGIFGTTVPRDDVRLVPTALLIPLVGFDEQGYRLGYGGGFYDRTVAALASLSPRLVTIGIGYELGRLPTIHPQPYDCKLDHFLTA